MPNFVVAVNRRMASFGSEAQATSNELVAVIEELKERRAALDRNIRREEEERARTLTEVNALNERLVSLNESLAKKTAMRSELDRVIRDTSESFKGILQESKSLLVKARKESSGLTGSSDAKKGHRESAVS
ncbi:hypothetical protein, conserved [Trypanosoma brucei gambiense DAL972]|uniref:Sjogren s syndrome nuclear autoantigen 1 n=1 Tax=Trypanosoma brucei gambiense (strain MHOM/CI/86/DAL972) TaxID=679716 RepID=C9ZZY9_TRYB9|nr:hypothetical protein, conserved [Trypanosoma brucei gambiense DAL972]CBH16547.1 hypothetical protein, conserved [Trypanosoma brucei gambiense DAL972]|eukprot:XP_011778811.1 hypothetical protein, conserved [Trypanosoma brucei gambiense DAL972]